MESGRTVHLLGKLLRLMILELFSTNLWPTGSDPMLGHGRSLRTGLPTSGRRNTTFSDHLGFRGTSPERLVFGVQESCHHLGSGGR